MKKLNKLALGVALAAGTSIAAAGTVTNNVGTRTVSSEMSRGGDLAGTIPSGSIVIELGRNYIGDDKVTFTLSGADFDTSGPGEFELYTSAPGVGNDFDDFNFFSATANVVTMRASGPLDAGRQLVLSYGLAGAGSSAIPVTLGAAASGSMVTVSVSSEGPNDAFAGSADLFSYVNEFSGSVSGALSAVVDAEGAQRLAFVGGVTSDAFEVVLETAGVDETSALDGADDVMIVLSGDMSGIGQVLVDGVAATIDDVAGTATYTTRADLEFPAPGPGNEVEVRVVANGSEVLSPREFTVSADLILDDEMFTDNLLMDAAAGEFTMNGAQARVAQMSLNFGFIQWVKVGNLSDQPATISGDIVYNGNSLTNIDLGTVDAQSVATVGGGALEAALANAGVTAGTDVSLTLTVAANPNDIVFHAEKKDSTGRSISEVLTDATNNIR